MFASSHFHQRCKPIQSPRRAHDCKNCLTGDAAVQVCDNIHGSTIGEGGESQTHQQPQMRLPAPAATVLMGLRAGQCVSSCGVVMVVMCSRCGGGVW